MTISQKGIHNAAQAIALPLSVCARPVPVNCADWADANFYMSAESSYSEGRWTTLPFQRAVLNMMGNDAIEELDVIKSARCGYTKMLMACMAYMAAHRKRNQIAYLPTDGAASSFMKEHVNPMIRDVRPVREIASWHATKNHPHNTTTDKTFDNRRKLWVLGGAAGKNYREKSADTVFLDELDAFEEDVEEEGRPDLLAQKRNEGSNFGKLIAGSTPKLKHRSLIYKRVTQSDCCFMRAHIPCPDCGHMQPLRFENLIVLDRDDLESTRYACEECGSLWTQEQAYEQQADIIWRSDQAEDAETSNEQQRARVQTRDGMEFTDLDGNPVPTPRHVGVHIWSAYSPMVRWAKIMRDFFERKANPTALQTWWNQTLGRVWSKSGDVPPWKPLYERARTGGLERNQPAPWALLLTCGIDVQRDRLELEIVGWGEGKRSQSVDYRVIPGDTGDLGKAGPWEQIRAMVNGEQWRHPSGAMLSLSATAIDSGDQTQTVYNFCREFQQPRVIPVKGSDTQTAIVGMPKAMDVTEGGRKIRRGVNLWPVGVSLLKDEIYSFLKLERPTEESGDDLPPGYCEFPPYTEEYFRGLCSEQLTKTKNRRGFTVTAWEKIYERNEPLDCRGYARAAASVVGLDRYRAEQWQGLRDSLGVNEPPKKPDNVETRNGVTFRKSTFWNK